MKTNLFFFLSLFLIFCSCKAELQNEPVASGDEVYVELTISTSSSSTRTLSDKDEVAVNSIYLMLFEPEFSESSAPGKFYSYVRATDFKTVTPGVYYFDTKIGVDASTPDNLVGVILVNGDDYINDLDNILTDSKGKSYSEICRYFDIDSAPLSGAMTMWGVCSPAIDKSVKSNEISASLFRDRARVDVNAQSISPTVFSLEEIKIAKVSTRMSPMPMPDNIGVSPIDNSAAMKSVTIPADANKTDSTWPDPDSDPWHFKGIGKDNLISHEVYIPECDILTEKDEFNKAAIIVGGRYRGASKVTYYRVDFTYKGKDGTTPVDVLRNHKYVVNITDVSGPGEDTPEKAYQNVRAEITADVIEWTNIGTEIVFDGAHWFSVESKYIELGGSEGSQYALHVASDIPADEWKMQWEEVGGRVIAEYNNADMLSGGYFRACRPSGDVGDGDYLVVETLQEMNGTDGPRVQKLRIRVSSRLEIPVTVVQFPKYGNPWEDGGRLPFIFE